MQKRSKQGRSPRWEHNLKGLTSSLSPPVGTGAEKAQRADRCLLGTLSNRQVLASCWLKDGSAQLAYPGCSHSHCCLSGRPASSRRLLACNFLGPGRAGAAGGFAAMSEEGTFLQEGKLNQRSLQITLSLPQILSLPPPPPRDSKDDSFSGKDKPNNSYCSCQGFANILFILFNKAGKVNIAVFILQVGKLRQGQQ